MFLFQYTYVYIHTLRNRNISTANVLYNPTSPLGLGGLGRVFSSNHKPPSPTPPPGVKTRGSTSSRGGVFPAQDVHKQESKKYEKT